MSNMKLTDKEVLQKAIEMALDNGWKQEVISRRYGENEAISSVDYAVKYIKKHMDLLVGNFIHTPSMLFSHDFAKAFWGEESMENYVLRHPNQRGGMTTFKPIGDFLDDKSHYPKEWEVHLQQMVLKENPIDYLRKFLDNTETS